MEEHVDRLVLDHDALFDKHIDPIARIHDCLGYFLDVHRRYPPVLLRVLGVFAVRSLLPVVVVQQVRVEGFQVDVAAVAQDGGGIREGHAATLYADGGTA